MLKRRRWVLPLVISLAGIGVITAVLMWFYPQERLLLNHAAPLTDTTSWGLDQETTYSWLPDQSLLLLRYVPVGSSNNSYKASRFDPVSHQETPLPGLTAALAKSAVAPYDMQLSPDGKWLSWTDYASSLTSSQSHAPGRLNMKVTVASLDGSTRLEWPTQDYASFLWLADSRHWLETQTNVEATRYTEALIHSLEEPKKAEKRTIDSAFSPQDVYFNSPIAISINSDTVLTEKGAWSDQSATNELIRMRIGPQSLQPVAHHIVTLPPNAEITDIIYSPKGDRIAWVLNIHSVPAFARFLRRYLPSFSASPQISSGLWVSRADGSDMREVGHLPRQKDMDAIDIPTVTNPMAPAASVPGGNSYNWDAELSEARWMPDGKRISFSYKHTLYAVSVE